MTHTMTNLKRINFIENPVAAEQEWTAVAELLDTGVRLGEPMRLTAEHDNGMHMSCDFHLIDETGEEVDGGAASTLLGYLRDGYYGDPKHKQFTLRRVLDAATV